MKPISSQNNQQGVMLLEALIAIIIFSMAIIGLMGLQAFSIKSVTDSKFRTDAAFLADRAISAMWVDDKVNLAGLYNTGGARYNAWLNEVQAALPRATGLNAPTIAVAGGNMVTITLFWQAPNDTLRHQYITVAQIN